MIYILINVKLFRKVREHFENRMNVFHNASTHLACWSIFMFFYASMQLKQWTGSHILKGHEIDWSWKGKHVHGAHHRVKSGMKSSSTSLHLY